ncbi:MAG: IS110 family transposase [Actinomycetota bacterium]
MAVSIGVDSHKSTLSAAAVDELGRVVGVEEFANDPAGHRELARWADALEVELCFGIECSGSYGKALARSLIARGADVFEVPANLAHREARRQGRGKSDSIDAVAIARVVAREERLPRPRVDQAHEDLKLLSDHLDQLKRLRTQLSNRIHKELTVARPGYENRIGNLSAERHRKGVMTLLRGDSSVRAELVRRNVRELRRIDAEIKELKVSLKGLVAATGTSLTSQCGVGPTIAAKLLGEVGDIRNIRSKGAFARLSGTAPIPASSGKVVRHRLSRHGNRKLNHALHYIAVTRCRLDPETKVFMARKLAEGKSKKEAMRCLKRHLASRIYKAMVADALRPTELAASPALGSVLTSV